MSMTRAAPRYQRNSLVEIAPLKDELVLFHPTTNKFCLLNKTMAFIWSSSQSFTTAKEIDEQMLRSFAGASAEVVASDVDVAIRQMIELDLLVAEDGGV